MNGIELIEFNRTHRDAVEFVIAATDDYVACRCCLLNGLFPGLRLGAEALEKYLKAFVLYGDPSLDVRKHNHRIGDLASVASSLVPRFNAVQFRQVIDRLETHYRRRYPNVRDFGRDASTPSWSESMRLCCTSASAFRFRRYPNLETTDIFFRLLHLDSSKGPP